MDNTEWINRYLLRVWRGLVFLFPVFFFLALLAGLGAGLVFFVAMGWDLLGKENQAFAEFFVETLQALILIIAGIFAYVQLRQAAEQQQRGRLVAWKNSVQGICEDILKHPETYVPLLYGEGADKKQSMKFVAAFASLHSLETIYFMRKDEQVPPKDLQKFVETFITTSNDFQEFWRNETFRPAFTLEFQKEVNTILGSTTISPGQPKPAESAASAKSEQEEKDEGQPDPGT